MTEITLQLLCSGLIGFVLGIFSGMCLISFLLRKIVGGSVTKVTKRDEDDDDADWWKHGGNPPGVYDSD